MEQETATPAAAPAPASDDGFTYESASVPFEPAPLDTTAGAAPGAALQQGDAQETGEGDGEAVADAAASAAPTQTIVAKAPAGGKKRTTLAERTAELRRQTDRATYELRETERRIQERQAELARLTPPASARPATPARPDPQTSDATPPPHPNYRDFDTDELYETAVATWRAAMSHWQIARERGLERRLQSSVEARLQSEAHAKALERADAALVSRLDSTRKKYPDWDEKSKSDALASLTSPWYNPAEHGPLQTPFLSDLAQHHDDGPEFLYWLASHPEEAQTLADIRPTRPFRDALLHAPTLLPILQHFATPAGQKELQTLQTLHPVRLFQAIGALSVRLAAAPGGSAAGARHAITSAVPSGKPPGGSPGASGAGAHADPKSQSFDEWYAAENAREESARRRSAGISA
jgi:hypothetical protein